MNPIVAAVLVVSGIGLVCGLLLVIAAKFMYVPTDETVSKVREVLPGANCGACGFAGCDDYAAAVATGKASTNKCIVGADPVAAAVAEVMGVAAQDVVEMTSVVACRGCADSPKKFEYDGLKTCAAAAMFHGGPSACSYGCIGFGDCAAVCQFDAICLESGVAVINPKKCTGCGACIKACPKGIITQVPQVENSMVLCLNKDKGAVTRKTCSNGCIGCMKCEKVCKNDAVHVENNCAVIDYKKCLRCRDCETSCPVGAIKIV